MIEYIVKIIKTWTKNKKIITIWIAIGGLCTCILSLSHPNPVFRIVSELTVEWQQKLCLILFLLSTGLLMTLWNLVDEYSSKINTKTCIWTPPVWKHKKDGLFYCPQCAPEPSPLDDDFYCHKCCHGFGKGDVFSLHDSEELIPTMYDDL